MSRLITLQDWAKEEFGDLAPSERVLKKYAQGKMMAPPAIKVGRYWMIDRNSRFVGTLAEPQLPINANPKFQRIIADGC
ncbi:TPA: excisionase [Escherichia coli]|nr:excisionase [Escherichia coli]HBE2598312.1 excisionase [Escherichia coli]HCN9109148.1 excisionase [Escherichia coli]